MDSVGTDATNQSIEVFRLLSPPGDRVFTLTNPDGMKTRYEGFNVTGYETPREPLATRRVVDVV